MFVPLILRGLAAAIGAAISYSDESEENDSQKRVNSNKENLQDYTSFNAKKAFECIISSIQNKNDTFFYELRKNIILLRREYCNANSIVDALISYMEQNENLHNEKEREWIKANKMLLTEYMNLFFLDSYDERLRIYLTDKSKSIHVYKEEFDRIFNSLSGPDQIETYDELLGKTGDIYRNLVELYDSIGFISKKDVLHHGLVFDMANLILEKYQFYFCRGLDRNQFAEDIMNGIIHYIHNGLSKNDESKDDKSFIEYLFNRYLGNRKIKSYYYFLKMGTRILESLEAQYGLLHNEEDFSNRFATYIINNINNLDYPFFIQTDGKAIYDEMVRYYKATKHRNK